MKKVSVVVPCFNAVKYIDRCMESLLGQTIGLENVEIILVDDASTDNGATLGRLLEYEEKFPETIIVVPLERNMRQGGARNAGISWAGGEYLMFCDADDWLLCGAMERLYHMAKEQDADVVEFQYMLVTDETEPAAGPEDKRDSLVWDFCDEKEKKKFLISSSEDCSLGCCPKFYRMSMIRENHIRFAEHLIFEEPSFTVPVRIYEKKHVLTNETLYCFYQSPGSTMHGSWDDQKFDNIKVWMTLMQDLDRRGFLERYDAELECMFFEWGLALSVRLLVMRDYLLTKEELTVFKKITLQIFPRILSNPYVKQKEDGWNLLMKGILEMELTEENVPELNQLMKYYLQQFLEICGKA